MAVESLTGISLAFSEVDQITGFAPGKLTWPFRSYLGFAHFGLEVEVIDEMNYEAFADDPEAYIRSEYESIQVQDEMLANLEKAIEVKAVRALVESDHVTLTRRRPNLDDIRSAVDADNIAIVSVNYWALHGKPDEHVGHAVIITEYGPHHFELLDPGPPGHRRFRTTVADLEQALFGHDPAAANIRTISPRR